MRCVSIDLSLQHSCERSIAYETLDGKQDVRIDREFTIGDLNMVTHT
jgi:hypothetical protein